MTHPLDMAAVPSAEVKALRDRHAQLKAEEEEALKAWQTAAAIHKAQNPRLIYSAAARCKCGAGLAYLNTEGIHGQWMCSAVLKAAFDRKPGTPDAPVESMYSLNMGHDGPFEFAFYSIKSEGQPSAEGRTTRPADAAPHTWALHTGFDQS